MSRKGGFIGGYDPLAQDPVVYSGKWNLTEQMQAIAAGTWSGISTGEIYWSGLRSFINSAGEYNAFRSSPVQLGADTDWDGICNQSYLSLWMGREGTIWSVSYVNSYGRQGTGDTVPRSSPVQVGSLTNWDVTQLSCGNPSVIALKPDGTLWGWGRNLNGTLGLNDTIQRSSPTQIGSDTDWAYASSAGRHTLAIKTDGTLWAWGENGGGALGINVDQAIDYSSPVQVGSETNWASAFTGAQTSFAITTTGVLYGWGNNTRGRLGTGDEIRRSSPVQVATGVANAALCITGDSVGYFVKTDGTMYSFGQPLNGSMGQGDTVARSSPTQVGALTTWAKASVDGNVAAMVKTDGTLWGVGLNTSGELGDGTVTTRSSPVQIGSDTDWDSALSVYEIGIYGLRKSTT